MDDYYRNEASHEYIKPVFRQRKRLPRLQAQQNYLRQQRTIQGEWDEFKQKWDAERRAKEDALAEIERLKALLENNNRD